MMYTQLADHLRAWGLRVIEVDGWRTRGSSTFNPRGVVVHHTAGGSTGDMGSLRICTTGRSDLPGPLAQVGLGRSGTCYVIAAGRANHAGSGGYRGLSGNSSVWGIEAENNGSQPWPQVQLDAYYRLCAALLELIGKDANWVCGHKEWTTRKPDPHSLNMPAFRSSVASQKKTPATPGVTTVMPAFNPPHVHEPIVDALSLNGGVVLLGQKGGIYAYGGAPFMGGPAGQSYWTNNPNRTAARLEANNRGGYDVISNMNERYSYP